jgi:hypothetical protein
MISPLKLVVRTAKPIRSDVFAKASLSKEYLFIYYLLKLNLFTLTPSTTADFLGGV